MANFRGHMTTSGFLGIGLGVGATMMAGFSPIQGAVAGCFTAVGGLLPDLDLENSTPSRELFGLTAAVAPLVFMPRLMQWGGGFEAGLFIALLIYLGIRYFGATLFGKLSVHRGMFHSIPSMFIVSEVVFLTYPSQEMNIRLLMAFAMAVGFLSHLILDEIFSVQFAGIGVRLAKSAGSAMKLVGSNMFANCITYTLLCIMTYGVLIEVGWLSAESETTRKIFQHVERATETIWR